MPWHVSSCVWLMLLTISLNFDQLLLNGTDSEPLDKQKFRFNEVADFADVVEPVEEEKRHNVREKKDVDDEVARKARDEETDASTLRVALELTGDYIANSKQFDLSLEGKEEANLINQHKRSIPRKYTNILDLKYYYSKGLPIRGHLIPNELTQFPRTNKRETPKKRVRKLRRNRDTGGESVDDSEPDGMQDFTMKRSSLNIIPMMAESNPFISNLADATNDAYLKMRNYAATLMLILTTPKVHIDDSSFVQSPFRDDVNQKRPYVAYVPIPIKTASPNMQTHPKTDPPNQVTNSDWIIGIAPDNKNFIKQRVKKGYDSVLGDKRSFVTPTNFNEASNLQSTEQPNIFNSDWGTTSNFNSKYQHVNVLSTTLASTANSHASVLSEELVSSSPKTLSPLLWENDLLKAANIKLRRQTPEEIYYSNHNMRKGYSKLPVLVTNGTMDLEIENKMLTPPVANQTVGCHLNSQTDIDCSDGVEEEEDCKNEKSSNTTDNECNLTSQATPVHHEKCGSKKTVQRVVECPPPEKEPPSKEQQHLPQQQVPEQQEPEQQTPKQQVPEQQVPEQQVPEQQVPEQQSPQQQVPEQQLPQQQVPAQQQHEKEAANQTDECLELEKELASQEQQRLPQQQQGPQEKEATDQKDQVSAAAYKESANKESVDKESVDKESIDKESIDKESENGTENCKTFWTVPQQQIQQGLTEAVQGIVAPEKQLTDIKPHKASEPGETDNSCVKGFLEKTQNSSNLDFPTVELNLDSMANQLAKCDNSSGDGNGTGSASKAKTSKSHNGSERNNLTNSNGNVESVKPKQNGTRKFKKALFRETIDLENSTTKVTDTDATVFESDYDDSIDKEDSVAQLQRLRRDLFVVKQLEQLLDNLTGDTREERGLDSKIVNFRDVQNSQYDADLEIDDDITSNPLNIEKRGLFRKRRRKKKKAKSVWRHIFGVRSDDNRFLNQNFPNSQYAKYPM